MVKTVAIVSLSSGILGEPDLKHEVKIGLDRLHSYGLKVKFMPHALKGVDYIREHPEKRAEDLLEAFRDPEIDMILCSIGGDDTYRLLPYLFDNDELLAAVWGDKLPAGSPDKLPASFASISSGSSPGSSPAGSPVSPATKKSALELSNKSFLDLSNKIFLGFSDTTINHFMLHKVGVRTFYGQSFLPDICELGPEMLPYTRKCFEELIRTGGIREIVPSECWYEDRGSFDASLIGVPLTAHADRGFELLQGQPVFSGKILGGCIDSMHDFWDGERYADMPVLCKKYHLFPDQEDWRGRILLLESSEEKMSPAKYRKALEFLKEAGVFDVVSGVLVGKPIDEVYEQEYKQLLKEVIARPGLPIVCNINIGHALPRCIIPFGVDAVVDVEKQVIRFDY